MDEEILPEGDSVFADVLNEEDSVQSNILMEDSFSSIIGQEAITSTPVRRGRGARSGARGSTSANSKRLTCPQCNNNYANERTLAKHIKDHTHERLKCPQCGNTYANQRTFDVHVRMHAMKRASARPPSLNDLKGITRTVMKAALVEIKKEVDFSDLARNLNDFCSVIQETLENSDEFAVVDFLGKMFHDILKNQNSLLPSAMRSAVYLGTNKLLSSSNFRDRLKQELAKIQATSVETLNLFIGYLMLKLSDKILVHVLKHMRGAASQEPQEARQKRSSDRVDSVEFQQLVYHIGGAVVHGFLRKGKKYTSSHNWNVYVDLLKCKFLRQPVLANECSASVSSFTEQKDRGSLKHLNQEAFDFFATIFDMLMSLEGCDGLLPHNVVDDNVIKNDVVLCLWDDIVGSELTEEQSIDLLAMTINCCARVVSKGIMKRRLNDELKQAYSSVALRSRMAR